VFCHCKSQLRIDTWFAGFDGAKVLHQMSNVQNGSSITSLVQSGSEPKKSYKQTYHPKRTQRNMTPAFFSQQKHEPEPLPSPSTERVRSPLQF